MLDRTNWVINVPDYRAMSPEQKIAFRERIVRHAHWERSELIRSMTAQMFAALGRAAAAGISALARRLGQWRADYAKRLANREAVARLMELDETTLRDIGVRRSEIESIVRYREGDVTRRQRDRHAA